MIDRNKYKISVSNYVEQNEVTIKILRPVLQFLSCGHYFPLSWRNWDITTMFISMKERKKRIGTMKAIGIKSFQAYQFLSV